MKKSILILPLILLSACSVFNKSTEQAPSIYDYSQQITEDALYNDLAVIAHDSLEGRDTGSEGIKKAARYLADKYEAHGLQPVGDNGTYFQEFNLTQPNFESIEFTLSSVEGDSTIDSSVFSEEQAGNFIPLYGGDTYLSGEIVFAGKGMLNAEEEVNHFPENAEGKWIFILHDEERTSMAQVQSLMTTGALGIIIVSEYDSSAFMQQAEARQATIGSMGRLGLEYMQNDQADISTPALNSIHPALAAKILGVDSVEALNQLSEEINEDPNAFAPHNLDYKLEHNPTVNKNTIKANNIVAFLEGSDPELKDEVVVLSSHYDHVGIGQPDENGDALYNGADDDGSGTVATLHTALALAEAKEAGVGPKRSVLFLHVTAEEKGLLGSRYYSDHPIYSIENTVANINIDMIGRVDPEHEQDSNYVYIIGGEIISSGLDSLTQVANTMGPNLTLSKRYNDLDDPNQFYRRSDHWNFGRLGVPFVFFFNGVHDDYHRPSDEIDKITFGPYKERTQLVYFLTAILANSNERPEVDNQEFIERTQIQPR